MEPNSGGAGIGIIPNEVGIGIDFGMTYSGSAAVFQAPGGVLDLEVLPIRGVIGAPKFPSLVYATEDKQPIATGSEARIYAGDGRDGKVYELFKRWLGVAGRDGAGKASDATFLATQILKAIKSDVDDYLEGRGFQDARVKKRFVFTHPGTWEPGQVRALKSAIAAAGFPSEYVMLDEAIATAIGAAKAGRHPEILGRQEIIFICDIGGGTTDFALVQATDTGLVRMKHTVGGNPLLGMSNLDKVIALLVARKLDQLQPGQTRVLSGHIVLGKDLEDTWQAYGAEDHYKSDLLKQGEAYKRGAFEAWQAFRSNMVRSPDNQWVELTKADVQPFVAKVLSTLAGNVQTYLSEVATNSDISASQVRYVIIGGEGSALPDVANTLQTLMPSATVLKIDSTIATSLVQRGAAFYGLNPTVFDRRIAISYGVRVARKGKPSWNVPENEIEQGEDDDGRKLPYYPYYEVFLKRNDIVRPQPVKRDFTPIRSNQSSVTFEVLCGENENPLINRRIGILTLPLPAKAPKNYPLECAFTIGNDGLLQVTAVDKRTGKRIHKAFEWKVELLPQ